MLEARIGGGRVRFEQVDEDTVAVRFDGVCVSKLRDGPHGVHARKGRVQVATRPVGTMARATTDPAHTRGTWAIST